MADMNIPANDAPAVAPPTRTDDQILPLSKWVPIGKSNCVLDVHKPQRNPIFPIVVALLKNTNFFRAFTASSTIPAIYIQQFWDTMCFNSSTGLYSCQLDEQWFNLHKDILRDALDITPTNDNNPFVAPPSSDTVIEYVNTLGYPSTLRNVSAMSVNALYQPWRAVLSMINMCLTGKTAGYDRPRHPVLQILWGIIHRSNIDYAERIWEEFVQSIQTFLTDRKNLATAARGKFVTTRLQVKQKEDGIFISQDKYVTEILKKFGFSDVKTASTPMETHKPLLKDTDGEDVDEHLYRSMIGSLMYLTSSRHDIMFAVCVCARFQVNPKSSHLHAVKRIFRYLKGQPKLGIWYPKDSPFDSVAYTDSDYAGASLDRKPYNRRFQFLRCRLNSLQC
ncbi:hypothetical protein Tco_1405750 [Tanacetum coccineum]